MNTNTLNKEKIAIILEPHVQHLADMKARGKSLSEMLYWIRATHGWVLNPAQLERYLKQKESAVQLQADSATPSSMHCQTPPIASGGIATRAELEYQQLMSSVPTTPSNMPRKTPPTDPDGLATTA